MNFLWHGIAASFGQLCHTFVDDLHGIRIDAVSHAGTDDMPQSYAAPLKCSFHDIGGLFLDVLFTAVSNGRALNKIDGRLIAVVHVPECFFPWLWVERFFLKELQELGSFRKTGSRIGGKPIARIMNGHLPATCSAHGKTSNADQVWIDSIAVADRFNSFESVDFAGQFECIGVPTVRMKDDRFFGRVSPFVFHSLENKVVFAERLASTMKPNIQSEVIRTIVVVIFGYNQSVRLSRAVDF